MDIDEQTVPDRELPTAKEMGVIGKKVTDLRLELQQTESLRGKSIGMRLEDNERRILRDRLLIHIRIHILDGLAEGRRLTSMDVSSFLREKHRENQRLVAIAEIESIITEFAPLFAPPTLKAQESEVQMTEQ